MAQDESPETFSRKFGARVRSLRESAPGHPSQEACAHKIGIALSSWSRLERGLSVPHASKIPAIAKVLEVDMNTLFDGLTED